MGYEIALNKAWAELEGLGPRGRLSLRFLADEYTVSIAERRVLSLSCNAPAKDFSVILILHYLLARHRGLPEPLGEWQDFKELSAIEGYAQAFRKRALEPIIRKYGHHPQNLYSALERLPGRKAGQADAGIVLDVFEKVLVLINLWRSDDEFGPEANMLFDKNITGIFCTEDIVVLAGIVAASI